MSEVCRYWKLCGGCEYMGVPYSKQLLEKQQYIEKLYPNVKVEQIAGMSDPYHYRHKIYAAFGLSKKKKVIAGMYEEESHRIVNTTNCLIQNQVANRVIEDLVKNANDMHIMPFDADTGAGYLRHAYIRVSHTSGDIMLVLVIGSRDLPGSKEYVKRITTAHPEIKTVILSHNSSKTSMVLGKDEKILYGKGYITDTINGLTFRISPHSFFQVNPTQAEILYSIALDYANLTKKDHVLDGCCGTGTITLLAAEKAQYAIGMEVSNEAIRDAKMNASYNHVSNVSFYCNNADDFIRRMSDRPDVVFLDPPRAGFSTHFIKELCSLSPDRIVYISCNPETQVRDTKQFIKKGYQVKKIKPVDMFPFTTHVENIVLLQKLNS